VSLSAGSRLGPYEIVSALGAGGMGEVYRAKDPRLGRDVAIKVLPPSFPTDADRLRRYTRRFRGGNFLPPRPTRRRAGYGVVISN
jgi:serine/threonine protein kinase